MQPLKGLTVVTLEHAIAAPLATRQLADLGARVIKFERPGAGDFARGYIARGYTRAATFSACRAWPRTSSAPTVSADEIAALRAAGTV